MRVLITGATGLIGQEVVKLCHASGYIVHYLTTTSRKLKSEPMYKGFLWDPMRGEIDISCFEGVEVIIHLVGATVAKRWSTSYKKEIIDSRVETTKLIAISLKKIDHTVRRLVSASAIGIYPDSFQNYYMEDATERATGFLGQVVNTWENSVLALEALQIDVSLFRIGLVLSKKGGAFPKIKGPIQYGLGAVFGSGRQWQSWIHVQDLARLFLFAVEEELTGIYNAVAPDPVSNQKLTHAIAKKVGKKIRLPNVPVLVMKLLLGEMHILLFDSQRVSSTKVTQNGFQFNFENISVALEDLCADN